MVRAVVDVGSNSVTTTVSERIGAEWREIAGSSAVTRLGEGAAESGMLRAERMAATLDAIEKAWRDAEARGAEVVAAGTAAVRIARNAAEFRAAADGRGTPIAVLTGEEEAALGTGAVLGDRSLGLGGEVAILDVGGHSTELTLVRQGERRFSRSLPFGTLRVRAERLEVEAEGRVSGGRLFAAAMAVDDAISRQYDHADMPFPSDAPAYRALEPTEYAADPAVDRPAPAAALPTPGAAEGGTVVAVGSGPAALVALREGMSAWDGGRIHGARLDYEEIGRAVGWLMPMSDAEREAALPFAPALGRTLPACALILERLLHALRAEGLVVSTRGWRHAALDEGVFADLRRRSRASA